MMPPIRHSLFKTASVPAFLVRPPSWEEERAQMCAENAALTAENAHLTSHIGALNTVLESLKAESELLSANYDSFRLENENLRHTLSLLQRSIYGPKFGKTDPGKNPQVAEGDTFNEGEPQAGGRGRDS